MKKTEAAVIAVTASLSCLILIPAIVSSSANANTNTQLFISTLVTSFLAMSLGLYAESKQDKPNLRAIAGLALLNFIGVGIAVYNMLIDERR